MDGDQGLFPVNYTSSDPPSTTTDEEEAEYEMTEDDESTISHPISTPSVSTITRPHQPSSFYSMRMDDDYNDDRISSRSTSSSNLMTINPPILSPNITFVSKNLQKAVRATLLSTTLSPTPPEQWEVEQVADWLTQLGFETVVDQFIGKRTIEPSQP